MLFPGNWNENGIQRDQQKQLVVELEIHSICSSHHCKLSIDNRPYNWKTMAK